MVKDYSKDEHKIHVYFEIEELLSKAEKEYGKNIMRQYRCYAVVELKATVLKKEHTGQIMAYMNYINENLKAMIKG